MTINYTQKHLGLLHCSEILILCQAPGRPRSSKNMAKGQNLTRDKMPECKQSRPSSSQLSSMSMLRAHSSSLRCSGMGRFLFLTFKFSLSAREVLVGQVSSTPGLRSVPGTQREAEQKPQGQHEPLVSPTLPAPPSCTSSH